MIDSLYTRRPAQAGGSMFYIQPHYPFHPVHLLSISSNAIKFPVLRLTKSHYKKGRNTERNTPPASRHKGLDRQNAG